MATTFFGFAMADSMFSGSVEVSRREVSADEVKAMLAAGYASCVNPSHVPTLEAAKSRYGLEVAVPEKAPNVSLRPGDTLVVMSVRGLPRLGADRHEYTKEEIDKASFVFACWSVK